jgi:hypothetical protein
MTEEQKPGSAPYESLLKATVDKIQVQPFLFIIAMVAFIIALVVLGAGLGSADFRFTLVTIALLALIAILVYYIQEAHKTSSSQSTPPTTTPSPLPSQQKVTATDGGEISDASQQNENVTQQQISATGPGSSVSNVHQKSGGRPVASQTGHTNSISSAVHGQLRQVLLDCAPLGERELQSLFVDDRLSPWRNHLPAADTTQARVENLIAFLHNKHNVLGENGLVLFLQVIAERLDKADACRGRLLDIAQQLEPR